MKIERKKEKLIKPRPKSAVKVDDRQAFKPANLKKNEPFFDDKQQRSPEPKRLKEYYEESKKVKK